MTDDTPPERNAPTTSGPDHHPRRRMLVLALVVIGVIYVLDQLTKVWAVQVLSDGPVNVLGDAVRFSLTRNTGSAFSLFQGFTPLLAVIAVVITVVLVRMLRRATDPWMVVGLALVLAGALGNLTDRVFRAEGILDGGVIDFIRVGWWPTFNIADAAITVGVAFIIVRSFRRP